MASIFMYIYIWGLLHEQPAIQGYRHIHSAIHNRTLVITTYARLTRILFHCVFLVSLYTFMELQCMALWLEKGMQDQCRRYYKKRD